MAYVSAFLYGSFEHPSVSMFGYKIGQVLRILMIPVAFISGFLVSDAGIALRVFG